MSKKITGSRERRKGKPIRLLEEETAFVGVDVHKKTYTVAVWTEQREFVARWVQPADPAVLCSRLEPIRSQLGGIAYEAGPTGYGLYHELRRKGWPIFVVAPSRTPRAPGRKGKTDRLDARKLARLMGKPMLCPI